MTENCGRERLAKETKERNGPAKIEAQRGPERRTWTGGEESGVIQAVRVIIC